jgi:hypothetical protein
MTDLSFDQTLSRELAEVGPELSVDEPEDQFTCWFVMKYLDATSGEANDAFTGGPHDFGVDAVYIPVMDADATAGYVVQTKLTPGAVDADVVKNLRGLQDWIGKPMPASANERVRTRWAALNAAIQKGGKVRLVVATTGNLTAAASEAARQPLTCPQVEALDTYDLQKLVSLHPDEKPDLVGGEWQLRVRDGQVLEATEGGVRACIAVVPLPEVAKLPGIENKSLFSANVRYFISRSAVNSGIRSTLLDPNERSRFFLFHNGITIIAREARCSPDRKQLTLRDFSVVNGCQSVVTLFQNLSELSNDAAILVRVYETMEPALMLEISERTNNQNAVRQRDLRSVSKVQQSLRRALRDHSVQYEVKRGEARYAQQHRANGILSNETAAQLLDSWAGHPQRAHRKDLLFQEPHHTEVFVEASAEQIYLLWRLHEAINRTLIDPEINVPRILSKENIAGFTALAAIRHLEQMPDPFHFPPISSVTGGTWDQWIAAVARASVAALKNAWQAANDAQGEHFDTRTWLKRVECLPEVVAKLREHVTGVTAAVPGYAATLLPPG